MSKVTTRLGNQDIVNLAKQRFESQQKSKLPTVIVPLPSGGKIYPESHPLRSGKLDMRYLTAYDEDILTNMSYIREGVMFDRLLDAIIMTDVAVEDIAAVDKDGLIIYARILAYGAEYPVQVTDPKTNNSLDRTVDLQQLQYLPFNLESDENGEFTYNVGDGKHVIKFSYLGSDTSKMSVSETLKTIIQQVDDSRTAESIDEFIRFHFMARDAKEFRRFYADNAPGLDLTCEFEGEDGGTFKAGFRLGPDLFWF
jgi:hypothetical protein